MVQSLTSHLSHLSLDREFYKTTTVVKQLAVGDESLSVVNVNRSLFETIVRDLIVDGAPPVRA
jgi:hypothetical protein